MRTRAAALALTALIAAPLAAASTPAQATTAPQTQFITAQPWTSSGALRVTATKVSAPAGSQCIASGVSTRADAYRCFVGNNIYDPAFKSPTSTTLAFLGGGSHWVQISGVKTFEKHTGATPSIWRVQLANGAVCSASTGAGPAALPKFPYWVGICSGGPYTQRYSAIWRATVDDGKNANYPLLATNAARTTWSVPVEYPDGSGKVTFVPVVSAVR